MFLRKSTINPWNYRITVFLVTLLLLFAGNFIGCESEDWALQVDCNECYSFMPDSANLIVYVTINAENDSVPITIYRGDYENGEVDWQDTATSSQFYLYSEMNREYTVTATYRSGEKTIVAFDADRMHIYDGANDCGSPCYIVKGGIFDVKLLE